MGPGGLWIRNFIRVKLKIGNSFNIHVCFNLESGKFYLPLGSAVAQW